MAPRRLGRLIASIVVVAVVATACSSGNELGEHVGAAHAALDEERWGDLVAAEGRIIELQPADTNTLALAYVNRAHAFGELGRFDEAVVDATVAIDAGASWTKTRALAYYVRAFSCDQGGRLDEAISDWEMILELLPADHHLVQDVQGLLAGAE
jgi:tetratricopeptide (TPR) repeat protein